MKRFATIWAVLSVCFTSAATAQDIPAEYQQVLTALGKQGDYKANVLKVNIPRNDVSVTVANVKTPTPFGFGAWVALTKGDLLLALLGHRPADKLATGFKAALSELGNTKQTQ